MKKQMKSMIAAMLAVLTLLSCTAFCVTPIAADTKAAQTVTRPALLKSVTAYRTDYQTKKWVKDSKTSFKYKNAYPVLIQTYEYEAQATTKSTFQYTFYKNNLPKTRKEYKDGALEWIVQYNKNGAIERMDLRNEQVKKERIFQYADGAPYFTAVLHNNIFYNIDQPKVVDFTMEEIDSIAVKTRKNGLLEKTTNCGLYANWNADEEKEWQMFNGTYTVNYDENGIAHDTYAVFRSGPSGKALCFKVKIENGRVIQAIRKTWIQPEGGKAHWENEEKFVFQYTDTAIDNARYSLMINHCMITSDSSYYMYNWY